MNEKVFCLRKRNLVVMALLTVVTCGLYYIYWSVVTKGELVCMGAKIPTAFLVIIPFANFYFWYKYSEGFVHCLQKTSDPVSYFILLALLPFIGMFIVQSKMNAAISKQEACCCRQTK